MPRYARILLSNKPVDKRCCRKGFYFYLYLFLFVCVFIFIGARSLKRFDGVREFDIRK